jgi:hypothetical protein
MATAKKDPNPNTYFENTPKDEGRMHRLIALKLKNILLEVAYYNKGKDADSWVFDIVDPHEEADSLIEDMRFFGYLPPEPKQTEGDTKV